MQDAVELLGATFGGINVTKVAVALYSRGIRLEVPGVVRDFSDPAIDVQKTYTMLYKANNSYRAFCCREYDMPDSFVYTFRGDISAVSIGSAAYHGVVTPKAAPGSCPIEILAILWGPAKRDEQKVVDYVYSCVNTAPGIIWTDDRFGGNSWPNMRKTGCIYYRRKGTDNVQLLVGRENEITQFNA